MINKKPISACILIALIITSCSLLGKKELENSFVVKVSADKLLLSLSNNNKDEKFREALNVANEMQGIDSENYLALFGKAYREVAPNANLAEIFSTIGLRKSINFNSTNEEVLGVLQRELDQVINQTINILKVRIKSYGIRHQNVTRIDNSENLLIELPAVENIERVRHLIETQAKLEFWETYEGREIFSYLEKINANLPDDEKMESAIGMKVEEMDEQSRDFVKKYPLFAFLYPAVDASGQLMQGPVAGYAAIGDTSTVNYMLNNNSVKKILPQDLRFYWTYKPHPQDETRLQLLAIKVTTRKGDAPLDGSVITDVTKKNSENENTTIHLSMNSEGAKMWQRLTRANIGRSIAITLDDYAYAFPRVQAEIQDGQTSITGQFTEEEAQVLVSILQTGPLPAPVRIVEENLGKTGPAN
ncbi:MAG: hypothetical protein V2I54_12970 [Bacteroidales bacterium]|jgi:SecD/SecF fusion protein|nr:hypothetical protein [Bacteroidales bacterium]